ncbi:MAG TPA: hypothetical protein VFA74_05315 [Terriglobales bacterium]|nr:hypothetical protein [Terriglobales bacterium]
MFWDKTDDRSSIVKMNADLRDAQLELLSAHCATDRIRLRYSTGDIARHGQRETLRKAFGAATALHNYYVEVEKQISAPDIKSGTEETRFNEQQVLAAIACVAAYLSEQREQHYPTGRPLSDLNRKLLEPFFPPTLLADIRIVEMKGRRVAKPSFYEQARALGLINLPDVTHMASLTFEDVVVFNDRLSERALFHALVHAVQFQILGMQGYVDRFVRSFLRTQSHFNVPLEAHAFTLECKFAGDPTRHFSVEEQVWLWTNQNRY